MFDNLNAHNGKDSLGGKRTRKSTDESRPVADREVPIGLTHTPAEVHSWLDGETPEAAVRQGSTARHVEFWSRINAEVEARREVRTPAHVQAQIMAALPQSTPRVITSFWTRPLEVTPAVAVAAAAGLVALGAALGISVRGR